MADGFAIGKALEIPDSVLKNIEQIDKKINDISKDSELMAQHFGSAMIRMGNGSDTLLKKLQQIHSIVEGIGSFNIDGLTKASVNMSATATEAERVATNVTNAAVSINRFGESSMNIAQLTDKIKDLKKQLTEDGGVSKSNNGQQELVNKLRAYEEELKRQNKSENDLLAERQKAYQKELSLIDKELEAIKKIDNARKKAAEDDNARYVQGIQAEEKYSKAKLENLRKEVELLEKADKARTKTSQSNEADLADWVVKKKKEQSEEEIKAAKIAEAYQMQEQKRLEAIAKEEDDRRKAKRAYYEESLKFAQDLDKKEEAAAKKRIAEEKKIAAEQEKQAKAQAKLDSQLRKSNYQAYVTSTSGALRTADKADTYEKRAQAINNLEAAIKKLRTTDTNYQNDLKRLSEAHIRLSQQQKAVEANFRSIAKSQHNLMNISDQLMRKLALIFSVSQIQGYLKNLVNVRGEFELQNTALASILQNKDKADKLFGQITELAVKSPFTLKELTTYTKSLSAYQIEYEKLYDTTKMLADVSAGLGVDMQRLILAFGQVKAANFLRGCLGYGTPIMLYDGSIKEVQDIKVGDTLINENGEAVNVLELIRGREIMYLVKQISGSNRFSYRVNRNHILTLWNIQEEILEDVYVCDYLNNSELYLGYKVVGDKEEFYDIEVTEDKIDDYYGFVLDGNKRFRLGDGTITHNTEVRQFTEAGFNILGELAKYYSELEGNMVTVGDVQERVTKRMVEFGAVEEVFKRVTSAGGIFYNMQEKQAETIAGQTSNLQDSIDIMLNDIGKANDGVIRNMIVAVKTVVQNWEVFANILNASVAGFVIYTAKTILAAKANGAFAASTTAAATAQKGLAGVLVTTTKAFRSFLAFAKNNPFILIATAAVYAYNELSSHIDKVESARKEYDRLSNSIVTTKRELSDIVQKISDNNTAIQQYNDKLKNLSEGSEEYKKNQERLNKAQTEQTRILNELKSKFPEVYDGLVKQKDGTVDLTEAQKQYNEELEKTRALNILMQQGVTFFGDDIKTDFKQLNESYEANKKATEGIATALQVVDIEATKAANSANKLDRQYGIAVQNILKSSKTAEEKLKDVRMLLEMSATSGGVGRTIYNVAADAIIELNKANRDLTSDTKEAERELQKVIENVLANAKVATAEQFRALDEESKKSAVKFAQQFIEEIPSIKNEFIQQFVNEKFQATLGITFDFKGKEEAVFSAVEKQIKDYLEKNKLTLVPEIKAGKGENAYFDNLRAKYKEVTAEIETLNKATEERSGEETNKERLQDLEAERKQIKQVLLAYGELNEEKSKKKGENEELKRLKEQLSFIQRVNSEYKKLLKYYNKEEARLHVINSMKDEAAELGISDIFLSAQFDNKGILSAIENLKTKFANIAPELSTTFAKAISGISIGMDIEVREEQVKNIQDKFSQMFGSYELSVELDKLGLDKNLASQLFGVEIFDLSELRSRIEPFKKELQNTLGTSGVSAWEEMNKKISDAEAKALQERLKTYSQYLKKSVSERVAIEMDAQKKIAEVRATKEFTPEQQERITTQIKQEAQTKKDQQAWKEFQDSELYIKMFEDLEFASTKALDVMEQKLIQVRKSLKNLSPTELKQINEQLEKIREVKISRNPFKGLQDNIKNYIDYLKVADELNDKFITSQSKEDELSQLYDSQSRIRNEIEAQYAAEVKLNRENSAKALMLKDNLKQQDKILDITLKQLVAQGKITQEIANQIRAGEQLGNNAQKQINSIGSTGSQIVSSIGEITGMLGNFGVEFGETFEGVLSGIGQAFEGLERIDLTKPMSIISGTVSVVAGIGNSIASLFGAGDNKKEKEIKRQIELVENLQNSYEKLEQAIEDAYSIDTYKASNENAIANLKEQNEALEKAIAAEQDKKKTDDDRIKEWQQQIEDNLETIEELNEEFINSLGGFGSEANVKSAAQEFADAWLEAYLETGDGLDALSQKWDEYIQNVIAKQLMLRGTEKYLKPVMDMLDGMLEDAVFSPTEAKDLQDKIDQIMPQLNEFWKAIAGSFDLDSMQPSGDTMSELQRGITSLSESTGQALESLLNSVRYFTSDSNAVLHNIYNSIAMPTAENPFLAEMKVQSEQLRLLYGLFNGIVKNVSGSGRALSVRIV